MEETASGVVSVTLPHVRLPTDMDLLKGLSRQLKRSLPALKATFWVRSTADGLYSSLLWQTPNLGSLLTMSRQKIRVPKLALHSVVAQGGG